MDTITKSPIESFQIAFNFSTDLLASETITTKTVTCVSAADGSNTKADIAYSAGPPVIAAYTGIVVSEAISSTEVVVVIHAGVEGEEHQIQCVIETSIGSTFQRDLLLAIQAVADETFNKQPEDSFMFDVNFANRLEAGDTLASVVGVAKKEADGSDVSSTVMPFSEVISPKAAFRVAAGVDGETYLLSVIGTSAAGYVFEKILRMNVQERK